MKKVSFLIIDPSYIIRKGLGTIIENLDHTSLFKGLESAEAFFRIAADTNPDFVIINTSLAEDLALFKIKVMEMGLKTEFIGLTGGMASQPPGLFVDCIDINEGKGNITNKIEKIANEAAKQKPGTEKEETLSEREKAVVKLVASGFTNKEIADKLFISAHTVITHRKNISNKLGIRSISGLTVYAVINKIIDLKDLR